MDDLQGLGYSNLLAFLNRKATTQNQLRGLEYVYIMIGLAGVLDVAEVQTTILYGNVENVLSRFRGEGFNTAYCS